MATTSWKLFTELLLCLISPQWELTSAQPRCRQAAAGKPRQVHAVPTQLLCDV